MSLLGPDLISCYSCLVMLVPFTLFSKIKLTNVSRPQCSDSQVLVSIHATFNANVCPLLPIFQALII